MHPPKDPMRREMRMTHDAEAEVHALRTKAHADLEKMHIAGVYGVPRSCSRCRKNSLHRDLPRNELQKLQKGQNLDLCSDLSSWTPQDCTAGGALGAAAGAAAGHGFLRATATCESRWTCLFSARPASPCRFEPWNWRCCGGVNKVHGSRLPEREITR